MRPKKGDLDTGMIIIIFDLLLLALMLYGLLSYVSSIETNTYFDKKFISRDIALLIDTIYASPYDIVYQYDSSKRSISDFDITFINNRVLVKENSDESSISLYYPFASDETIRKNFSDLRSPSALFIEKYSSQLKVTDTPSETRAGFCSVYSNTTDKEWKSNEIILDPGTGLTSLSWSDYPTKDIMWTIGKQMSELGLNIFLPAGGYPGKMTISEKVKLVKDRDPKLIIGLHPSEAKNSVIPIIIYYNAEGDHILESKKLACLIQTRFSQDSVLKTTFSSKDFMQIIEPISISALSEDDPRRILSAGKAGIVIEIGNIAHPKGESIYDGTVSAQYRIIIDLIEALGEYYE